MVWKRKAVLAAVRTSMIPTSWMAEPRPWSRNPARPLMSFGFCSGVRAAMSLASMSVEVHGHPGLQLGTDGLEVGASARTLPGRT